VGMSEEKENSEIVKKEVETGGKKFDFSSIKSKLKHKHVIYILISINALAGIYLLLTIIGVFSNFSEISGKNFEEGRSFSIFVESGNIEYVGNKEDEVEIADEAAPEEIVEENVAGNEAEEVAVENEDGEIVKTYSRETANLGIIVTELGLKKSYLENASRLPNEVAFAFSPYIENVEEHIDQSIAEGRQTLMNLFMEPSTYPLKDTGPFTIQSHFEDSQNVFRFRNMNKMAGKVIGFLTNHDEVVTHNLKDVTTILKEVKNTEKFFGFFKVPVNSYLEKEAKPLALDILPVDYLVDSEPGTENILARLNDISDELQNNSRKIVIAIRAYPKSIETLHKWLEENKNNPNVNLAPISYLVTDN
jgi:polysaccharide deacetylase 2 family uncharacterized protein YibQ